jgi:photosystem II stability/assembly factor-like uncharacterized protein
MDSGDSLILYAAAYEHRRLPYIFTSGGQGSGIYKTTDGGETWNRIVKDLPAGIMGRIGLAAARSRPGVVYALIEHKDGGLWRSEDKGETWERTCDTATFKRVNTRPFYYSHIFVDPSDDKVVYVLSTGFHVSTDMGQKFRSIGGGIHPDHHALWIDPSNPLHLIAGNDGGIDLSYDGGKTWLPVQNMDLAEVYQVGFDMQNPYHVYCGLQDNGSWGGPSASPDPLGIANDDWSMIGSGDGFFAQPDPSDPAIIYRNSQMNGLTFFDSRLRRSKNIKPTALLSEPPYRFNWNSPIHISPHDPKTVYCGGNFLFMSRDRGMSWTIISPDLTTDNPEKMKDSGGPITPDNTGAESHCTIVTIAESPVQKGLIWCGTDDGNVQITRDGGQTWQNVVRNIPGLPPNTWCSRIEASHFEAGLAYASFDGHRTDDYSPYVYKTTDFGKTWRSLKSNLPFGWVHVVREDTKNKNLLFIGTEFSIFASLDGGGGWFSLKNNLPTVAVNDIALHPRENDLIIGTHGRGIWILDDISCLREMTPEVLASDCELFSIRPATAFFTGSVRESFTKPAFTAANPPYGLIITAYLKAPPKEKPRVLIKSKAGETIYELNLQAQAGILREAWNLQFVPKTKEGKRFPPAGVAMAALPLAAPGDYSVELQTGGRSASKNALVLADPRFDFQDEARRLQAESLAEISNISRKLGLATTAIRTIRRELDSVKDSSKKKEGTGEALQAEIRRFEEGFRELEKDASPQDFYIPSTREASLRGGSWTQQILTLGLSVVSYPQAPTKTDLALLGQFQGLTENLVKRLNAFIKDEIPKLNKILRENNISPLKAPEEIREE